jgi:Skp family chaperone for outer membrane proteins
MEQKQTGGIGDISMIRDILMGQQMNDYDQRFGDVSKRIQQMEQDLRAAIKALEDRTHQRFQQMADEHDERFARLQQNLDDNTKMLEDRIARTSKADKAIIGAMLIEIGKQLVNDSPNAGQ